MDETTSQSKIIPNWPLIGMTLVVTLALVTGGLLIYDNQSQIIRQRKVDELRSIAELKVQQIIQWRQERLSDARMNSIGLFFDQTFTQWLASPDDASLKKEILSRLKIIVDLEGYQNVILSSVDGRVLLSVNEKMATLEGQTVELAIQAARSGEPMLGDFNRQTETQQIYLDAAAPVFYNNSTPKAVLILRIDPRKYLYPLIQSWPTPSQSGETLLVRKEGEHALYLNPLRHNLAGPLSMQIPLSSTEVPSIQAALGVTGEVEGPDYRNVEVLAELIPVQGTIWHMVAKVDKSEVLSEVRSFGLEVLFIVILAVLLTILLAAFVFNYRQRVISRNLFQTERLSAEAQEEIRMTLYSIGDGVITTDKESRVTRLNPVAEMLTGWTETQAKGLPLAQVFPIINEFSRGEIENPVERVLREGTIVGLANHTLLLARDGVERPIADSGAPIRNKQGQISGVVLVFRDQTQERAAHRERALLEHTIATSLNEIYLFDADTFFFRFVNDGALKNLGYDMERMQSMTPLDIKPELTPEVFRKLIQPLIQHEKPVVIFETNHQRVDGSRYPVEVHLQLFEYESERVFLATINDITERKQAEKTLQENEMRLVQAQAAAQVGNWELNLADHVMWGSDEVFRIYGLEKNSPVLPLELVRRAALGEDRPRLDAELQALMQRKGGYDIEFRIHRENDGLERVIHSVAQLMGNEEGVPVKVVGVIQDITELRQIEKSLIESEQRYRSLFQNNYAVMFLINPENGVIVDANPAASDFYGWSVEELTHMNINQINIQSEEAIYSEMQLAASEKRRSFLFQHRKKNGQICDVEVFSGPTQINGEVYLYSIVHDITERKQAEKKVAEQLEELHRWYNATLGREARILELKREVNAVLMQNGLPPRYISSQEGIIHE